MSTGEFLLYTTNYLDAPEASAADIAISTFVATQTQALAPSAQDKPGTSGEFGSNRGEGGIDEEA